VFTLAKVLILCILCDEPCWASQWRSRAVSLPASYHGLRSRSQPAIRSAAIGICQNTSLSARLLQSCAGYTFGAAASRFISELQARSACEYLRFKGARRDCERVARQKDAAIWNGRRQRRL
jgi:hypothetical protein